MGFGSHSGPFGTFPVITNSVRVTITRVRRVLDLSVPQCVEDLGMYHYQQSEKQARNVCWPKHEGDINECCTEFYKAKQKTGNWSLDTGQSNDILP